MGFQAQLFAALIGNHEAQITEDTDTILITYQTAIHNYTMGDPIANYAMGKQMRTSCLWEPRGEADVCKENTDRRQPAAEEQQSW